MRRWWAAALALLLCLTAAGCQPKPDSRTDNRPITSGFSCTASAEYAGMTVRGRLTRETGGALTLNVTEPPTLRGALLTLTNDKLTVAIGSLKTSLDPGQYPQLGAMPVLLSALDAAAALTDGGERTAAGLQFSGETDAGRFSLLSDPATGNLLSLTLPDVPLTVTFSDFRRITPDPTD